MTIYGAKAEFVANELAALICKIDPDIDSALYSTTLGGEEYVQLLNVHGREIGKICVTADSFLAIAHDVLRSLG